MVGNADGYKQLFNPVLERYADPGSEDKEGGPHCDGSKSHEAVVNPLQENSIYPSFSDQDGEFVDITAS